eukprot:2121552-Amphidinium_carterae.1
MDLVGPAEEAAPWAALGGALGDATEPAPWDVGAAEEAAPWAALVAAEEAAPWAALAAAEEAAPWAALAAAEEAGKWGGGVDCLGTCELAAVGSPSSSSKEACKTHTHMHRCTLLVALRASSKLRTSIWRLSLLAASSSMSACWKTCVLSSQPH